MKITCYLRPTVAKERFTARNSKRLLWRLWLVTLALGCASQSLTPASWQATTPTRTETAASPSAPPSVASVNHVAPNSPTTQRNVSLQGFTSPAKNPPAPQPETPSTVETLSSPGVPTAAAGCKTECPLLLGVDEASGPVCREPQWTDARPIPFQMFYQGEYIGPHRDPHVPEYRLRVGDQLELVFRKTVEPSSTPYRLNVGDQIRVQSYVDPNLDTTVTIQPDGMITLRMLDQVRAEGRTISELQEVLEKLYRKYYKNPTITVTPVQLETKLNELRASVDSRFGFGGQGRRAIVTPDGTIQLPALGSVPAQGLTIDELKREIEERYSSIVHGMEVTPVLAQIAPRFVYILGEVPRPGRYDLQAPTTVMQALSMAGGWQIGGNLRQIVIFRRTDDWRLIATRVDLRGALYGKRPCPADELWVRDSDVIVVPKAPVQVADDLINLVFTQGIYRVLPNPSISVSFFQRGSIL